MNTTKIGKYLVSYDNSKEFHILKNEIFGQNCYNISLSSQKPYIIDVGAYIGLSTIYFKSIYPDSKILAFEPNPYAKEILKENIFNNGLEDIEVLPYAIDSSEGKKDFFIDVSSDNWQSTGGFIENSWNGKVVNNTKIQVGTKKLSNYLNRPVDLLKIDIEGIEDRVLKESEDYLDNVKNILIEYHPTKKKKLSKISDLLKRRNFKITILKDNKEFKDINPKDLLIIKGEKV